jgi:hypothetical protein
MDSFLILLFLLGVPCSYIVECFLLQEKDDHEGPFKSKNTLIYFPESGHTQRACLFDYIRALFGVYDKSSVDNVWKVRAEQSERFTCPFCLSFWVAFLFSVPAVLHFHLPISWFYPLHFGIAAVSRISYRMMFDE